MRSMEAPDDLDRARPRPNFEAVATEQVAWTIDRRQLHERLSRDWPGLAEAYYAAIELLTHDFFPGRDTLACHALRDFMNAFTEVVVGERRDTSFAREAVRKLSELWPDGSRMSELGWSDKDL